jgi:hypothetical protein
LPVQGLFLVALAIVTAAEGSPVKILDLIADGFEGMLGGLVEGAAGAQRHNATIDTDKNADASPPPDP